MATTETQTRILDAAIALFNENGVSAVSVNRIAAAAGISRGNLHYHFRTKEALIAAIFERMAREMEQGGAHDLENPTLDHLRAMFLRYAGRVWTYRFFFRKLTVLLSRDPVLHRHYQANREHRFGQLVQFFEALVDKGVIRRPEPPVTIEGLVTVSWIFCDNWLTFLEAGGEEVTSAHLEDGFELAFSLFRPYLTK